MNQTNEYFNPEGMEMIERSIGFRERRYIEELRILTKATGVDCLVDDRYDRIIYVIQSGDMGLAIGKNGENIKKLARVLGKHVEMVEFSDNREKFVSNCFKPAEIVKVEFGTMVSVYMQNKTNVGLAIGRGGATIEKARALIKRFYGKDLDEMKYIEEQS